MSDDRSVKISFRAEVDGFIREINRASTSLDDVVRKSGDLGGASESAMGRLVQSARLQSGAWNQVAGSLAGVGAAWTGVNVLVAKTGIEYNSLQQTSRAALKTLLGDTEAVNKQMEALNEFTSTSPFSKATFIEAQQTMLGFGIEAEKVIPYLSAINESTAAVGGNNQTIAELATIFSKVSSSAKITAEDLNQFGDRGVNAAEIIGSQMDMTAGEIRSSITAGTLDAGEALDALAAGMSERFEGASANVKDTLEGAFDRVKAAWRDMSASMVEPLVSAEGGGLLVDATNSVADFMRMIDKMPDSTKNVIGVMSGIGGAATLAAAGFAGLLPRIVATRDAWVELNMASRLAALKPAAGIAGVALLGVGLSVATVMKNHIEATRAAADYAEAIKLGGDAAEQSVREQAARALQEDNVAEAMRRRGLEESLALEAALGSTEARQTIVDAYDAEIEALYAQADAARAAKEPTQDLIMTAQGLAFSKDRVVGAIDLQTEALGRGEKQAAEYGALLGDTSELVDGFNAALEGTNSRVATQAFLDAAAALGDLSENIFEANQQLRTYADFQLMLEGSVDGLEAAYDKAEKAIKDNGKTLDNTTEKGRANRQSLRDIVDAANAVTGAMVDNGDSTQEVAGHVDAAREAYVKYAQKMGDARDETELTREAMSRIPGQVTTTFFTPGMLESQDEMHALNRLLQEIPPETRAEIITIGLIDGAEAAKRAIDEVQGKTVYIDIQQRVGGRSAPTLGAVVPAATGGRLRDLAASIGGVADVANAYSLAAGGSPSWVNQFGRVRGPGTPTSDSVHALISRDEFVVKAESAARYGYDALYAINAGAVNRDNLRDALGFAAGGTPARAYTPTYVPPQRSEVGSAAAGGNSYTTNVALQGLGATVYMERTVGPRQARLLSQQGNR